MISLPYLLHLQIAAIRLFDLLFSSDVLQGSLKPLKVPPVPPLR